LLKKIRKELINTTMQKSDHFNGEKFFNPTIPPSSGPSLKSIFKMLKQKRSKWPSYVENKAAPRLNEALSAGDISITFVNHATFLIQLSGLNILTDPVWSKRASPISWAGPKRVRKPGIEFDKLPEIDLILISHNHYDHLDIATLRKLSKRFSPTVLVASGDKKLVESAGFKNVYQFDWWEEIQINPDLKVTFTPAQHFSSRSLTDRNKSLWGSYMVSYRGQLIYFGGDAGYSNHFSEIKKRLGAPDIALLGIGAYEPRWFMKTMHMNPSEAVMAHKDLESRQSIGMHFGTFKLSSEAIDQPLIDLKEALVTEGLSHDKFVTLEEGETRIYRYGETRPGISLSGLESKQ
jgi:L-ascorbate metabolism protein UlaG (beta-lactamase superfamily)